MGSSWPENIWTLTQAPSANNCTFTVCLILGCSRILNSSEWCCWLWKTKTRDAKTHKLFTAMQRSLKEISAVKLFLPCSLIPSQSVARPSLDHPASMFRPVVQAFQVYPCKTAWPRLGQACSALWSELEQPSAVCLHWTAGDTREATTAPTNKYKKLNKWNKKNN